MNHSELSCIEVSKIMQGKKKVIFIHSEKHYLLSITRRGKLILTAATEDEGIIKSSNNNKIS